ncbi:MAG: pyridoxal phosphate-dependent aminotransferase [Lachnospiraceae bacterium]|nr:pyridoxal phosphate-dependent aminotransferase [Candidatus Merdinaster equi]
MSRFDELIDRRNTQSYKWDVADNELPMWVADMDFQTAPAIIDALKNRVDHGVFGYSIVPEEWYEAYIGWWKRRHKFEIKREWLIFCTGVVPAISTTVRKLTTAAENVIVITPAYNIFFNSIYNNGRNIVECELIYRDGKYELDYVDLEEKCSNPQSTLLILCNPHNPTGIIWTKEQLVKIGDICARNNVTVLSDEIHCDLTLPGCEYTPFASASKVCEQISVNCISPTKTFNIAGLQSAAVCVPNSALRHKVWRALNTDEVAEGNAFAADVAIAAFNNGEEWLEELRGYLAENRRIAEEYIAEEIPALSVVIGEATYLLWIDCRKLGKSSDELAEDIRRKTGLYLSEGCEYRGDGRYFLRMNLACPRSRLMDGLERLKRAVSDL